MPTIRAAGGVVHRRGADGRLEVLLVHRPRYDDWSLPKGKLDGDEDEAAAAVREVAEETGLICALGEELGVVSYRDRRGRPKTARYWAMTPLDDRGFEPNDETDARCWVPIEQAQATLSYPRDAQILDALERLDPGGLAQ